MFDLYCCRACLRLASAPKGLFQWDGDVIEAPDNLNLRLIQRGDHLLLKDLDNKIKITLLNINRDDLITYQPDLVGW